ncbi:MAG: signal peptidase I, partial [Cystobacter sp.]
MADAQQVETPESGKPLPAGKKKTSERVRDLLLNRWAPVCVLVVALIPYIILVQYRPGSSVWALPLIQTFAKLVFAWLLALFLWPLVLPQKHKLYRARHEADDVRQAVARALARPEGEAPGKKGAAPRPTPEARAQLEAQLLALELAVVGTDVKVIEMETQRLMELAQKQRLVPTETTSDVFWAFAKAVAIALVIRMLVIEPYRIPSGSMLPTLEVGDFVFISKFIYGVRIPMLNKVPFVIVREPERGDVIVFENPVTGQDYIKRVVGLPGDRVELREGTTYINGQPVPRQLIDEDKVVMERDQYTGNWEAQHSTAFREQLDEHTFTSLKIPTFGRCTQEGPYLVPARHVFVMGDNRDNSLDSRYGLGRWSGNLGCDPSKVEYVPFGHIKGKALIVWLSFAYEGWGSRFFGGA